MVPVSCKSVHIVLLGLVNALVWEYNYLSAFVVTD